MFRSIVCTSALLAASAAAHADLPWYVMASGYADAKAQTGYIFSQAYNEDGHGFDSGGNVAQSQYSGSSGAAARGTLTFGTPNPLDPRQISDASIAGNAMLGSLHGVASVDSTVFDSYTQKTMATGSISEGWGDTIYFHTGAAGADYTFSLTLADTLTTSVAPDSHGGYPGTVPGGQLAGAQVVAGLTVIDGVTRGGLGNLSIRDFLGQGGSPNGSDPPPLYASPPASRTQTVTIHVDDGSFVRLQAIFGASVYVANANATATADASDTAYFDLYTDATDASYDTASGMTYPTSGDPTAAPPIAAVPEPSEAALLVTGLAAMGWVARRRRSSR